MDSADVSPILINSDDDSDVEIIKEEQNTDLDVIFVSQSAPSLQTKCMDQGTSCMAGQSLNPGPISRNLSLSSNLGMALTLDDQDLGGPIDLSSRKVSNFSDISDVSDDSSDSESSDEGIVSDDPHIPVDMSSAFKVESLDVSCPVPSSSSADQIVPLQDAVVASSSASSSLDSSSNSVPMLVDSDTSIFGVSSSSPPSVIMDSSNYSKHGTHRVKLEKAHSCPDSTKCYSNKDGLGTSSGTNVAASKPSVVNTSVAQDLTMHNTLACDAQMKSKDDTNLDIWDTIKKDLDFLNDTNLSQSTSGAATVPSPTIFTGGSCSTSSSVSNFLFPTLAPSQFCTQQPTPKQSSKSSFSITSILTPSSPTGSSSQDGADVLKYVVSDQKDAGNHLSSLSQSLSSKVYNFPRQSSVNKQLQLPPKKQLRCTVQRHNSCPSPTSMSTKTAAGNAILECCSYCRSSLSNMKSSQCLQGHVTCRVCLEDKVKLVLTGKTKESLRCVQPGCDSYYPMSELKQSLPSIVVEILEDKLENDYVDYIANMILKNAGGNSSPSSSAATMAVASLPQCVPVTSSPTLDVSLTSIQPTVEDANSAANVPKIDAEPIMEKKDGILEGCPSNWVHMNMKSTYMSIPLEPESPEYVNVALKFHNSMSFPQADIIRISRIQNPILWKYHTVKRTQMIIENDGLEVQEDQLFHGTTSSVMEAICKKGFDWRLSGKNAAVYGQGSYFALNASYSHMYTDHASENRRRARNILANRGLPVHLPHPISAFPGSSSSGILSQTIGFGPSSIQVYPPVFPPINVSSNSNNHPSMTSLLSSGSQHQPAGAHSTAMAPVQGPPPASSVVHGQPTQNNKGSCNTNQVTVQQVMRPVLTPGQQTNAPGPMRGSVYLANWRRKLYTLQKINTGNKPPTGLLPTSPSSSTPSSSSFSSSMDLNLNGESTTTDSGKPRYVHKMFLAKVLVGKFTGGHAGLRTPPPLCPDYDRYGKTYDSCVDNINNPKIFVIFDSAQAYPEYVLEYYYDE